MVDRYTKSVLTVIAFCLVWLSVKDLVVGQGAVAQSFQQTQAVIIRGIDLPDSYYDSRRKQNNVVPTWKVQ